MEDKMSLLNFPTELLWIIIQNLEEDKDISSFVRTNSLLYDSLSDYLYQNNAMRHNSGALEWAARHGLPQVALRSLVNGGDLDRYNSLGHTPLSIAAGNGNEELVRMFLAHGVDHYSQNPSADWDDKQETPLMRAASAGHELIVQLLLDHGAPIDWYGTDEKTPLHLAAEAGQLSTVKLLTTRGANVSSRECHWEDTPLSSAARHGYLEIVKCLIQNGASVHHRNAIGETPLFNAVGSQHWEIVEVLLQNGAKVDEMNTLGSTALDSAAWGNNIAGARLLIERGAQVNSRGWYGQSPLFTAVRKGFLDVARLLVNSGADVNSQCELPWRDARDYPEYSKFSELSQRRGADPDPKRSFTVTPLLMAAASGNEAMCRLLIENGADVHAETLMGVTPGCLAEAYGYDVITSLIDNANSGQLL